MTRRHRSVLSAAGLALALSAAAAAAEGPRVLAAYPPGTFLENLSVGADGAVVLTSYFARTLERVGPDDAVETFATVDAHPVSILPDGDGWIVAAHGAPFTSGPGFTETQMLLRLDASGAEVARIPAPAARFLNGMARLPDGRLLVADSIAGTIWQLPAGGATLTPWLADAFLARPADLASFQPGANGLKLAGDLLYVSNSARGELARIAVGPDGAPAGAPEIVAAPGGIDDFWVGPDGSVTIATHGAALVQLGPDGASAALFAEGCDGCTAVAPRDGAAGPEWIVLTTGGFLEGLNRPARVLAVPRAD